MVLPQRGISCRFPRRELEPGQATRHLGSSIGFARNKSKVQKVLSQIIS